MYLQQQKTQLPSLTPPSRQELNFKQNYHQLLTGINRIRYIKKKQQHNQHIMSQHLTTLLKQLQLQQAQATPKIQVSLPKTKSQPTRGFMRFKYKQEEDSPYKTKNMKILKVKNPTLPLPRDSTDLHFNSKENHPQGEHSHRNSMDTVNLGELKPQSRQQKQRVLFQKKHENYQEMRQLRLKRQERQRQIHQQKLNAVRERRSKALLEREEGKRRIQEQYYRHIDKIKRQKQAEKEQRAKLGEKQYQQLLQVQQQEEEELAVFEKSILLQQELKSFIERASHSGKLHDMAITDDTTLL